MNRFLTPEITVSRMTIKDRLSLRKKLNVTAGEFELLELVSQYGLSLQKMADELSLSKKGVDKSVSRLIQQGHLSRLTGKLALTDQCRASMSIDLSTAKIVEQSTTNGGSVEQSTTTYKNDRSQGLYENVEQSTTKPENVEQSTTVSDPEIVEQSTTFFEIVELSTTNVEQSTTAVETEGKNVEQSTTNEDFLTHIHTHTPGGSSNNINNLFFDTLKEEKNKENKINPPYPLDKNKETKKEESRVRRQNRAAEIILGAMSLKPLVNRRGLRLKRLPKRRKEKVLNFAFEAWWGIYEKKVGAERCKAKWEKLTEAERAQAMTHTPLYVASTPDKQYRKNPETYLNQKSWNNEIIKSNGRTNHNRKSSYGIGSVPTDAKGADSLKIRLDELDNIEL